MTIYDIGSEGGVSYIAIERVEGSTLRELLGSGALPAKKLLPIVTQIAEGLAKAHETGIVHRDLKPENVMVTKDGLVKILDFGLAKLTSTMSGSGEGSQLPTMTETTPGVVVGTVGYMSPEQASGGTLDFRSDQFAVGSILYEMATGKKAFQKKTAIDTLAAILNEDPPSIATLNPQAPTPLQWIVERCLAKDPEGRHASTKDVAREFQTLQAHLSGPSAAGLGLSRPVSIGRRAAMMAMALALLGGGLVLRRVGLFAPPVSPMRFRQVTFGPKAILHARFLRDGESVVYSALVGEGPHELFLARPGSPESRNLGISSADILSASASDDLALLIGPDRLVGTLGVVSLMGGVPREMLEKVSAADWLPDGKRLAVVRTVEGFDRLEFPVGNVVYRGSSIGFCRVSRNGETVAINTAEGLLLLDRAGKRIALKAGRGGNFAWSPRGDEIWFDDAAGGLSDLRAVAPSGETRFLASLPGDFVLMDVSADGRILLERGIEGNEPFGRLAGDSAERSLKWLDATAPTDISRDGRSLLFNEFGPGMVSSDVYIRRGATPPVRLGPGVGVALSPDGTWAVTTPDLGASRIDLVPTGPGTPRTLPGGGLTAVGWVNWLPDGERIVFGANAPNEKSRLYVQDISGGLPRPISPLGVSFGGSGGQVAPDGSVVVGRDEDRHLMLYPTTGNGPPRAIPGIQPEEGVKQWSEDGKSVYVVQKPGRTRPVFLLNVQSGERTLWKEFPISDPLRHFMNIALTRDGKSYVWTTVKWTSNLFVLSGVH